MDSLGAIKLEVVAVRPRIAGSRIGRVTAITTSGSPVVDFPGNPLGPRPARWVGSFSRADLVAACARSQAVLLVFEDNDASKPVIVDTVLGPTSDEGVPPEACAAQPRNDPVAQPRTESPAPLPAQAAIPLHTSLQLAQVTGMADGKVLVELAGEPGNVLHADSTCALRNLKDPVLLLRTGEADVVIGQLLPAALMEGEGAPNAELVIKGENVRIEAGSLLSFKAGSCSFELDARGRAVLVSDQIVSRARTSNKLQGGSVQIN
jgi:hypothetical protein